MTRSRPAGPIVLDIGSTLVLVGVALALTRAYVAHERFFYTADWGNYEVMAHRVLEEWRRSPLVRPTISSPWSLRSCNRTWTGRLPSISRADVPSRSQGVAKA